MRLIFFALCAKLSAMNKLRAKRAERGLTLDEVAKAVSTNVGNLSRIECDKQLPSPALAIRLCRFYGIELADVFAAADTHQQAA